MALLTRILAPVEFSPRCQGAIQYASALARQLHCEIDLLHVVIPPSTVYGFSEAAVYTSAPELQAEVVADRTRRLSAFGAAELRNLAVTRRVLEGDPAHAIVQYARKIDASLIVMATRAHGPFRRFLLGSVTAKVIHDAECPVCTGPHMEQAPTESPAAFRHVLCAVDLSAGSRSVLGWAAAFARECGAELSVVYAIPGTASHLSAAPSDPNWSAPAEAEARERIAAMQQDLATEGEIATPVGDPPRAITETINRWKADLVVIGRGRSRGGMLGRIRTNAYAILREAPCPVVAV